MSKLSQLLANSLKNLTINNVNGTINFVLAVALDNSTIQVNADTASVKSVGDGKVKIFKTSVQGDSKSSKPAAAVEEAKSDETKSDSKASDVTTTTAAAVSSTESAAETTEAPETTTASKDE